MYPTRKRRCTHEIEAWRLTLGKNGGKLPTGMDIQRSFGATRSVEFDAVLLAGSPVPAPDALVGRDTKAGEALMTPGEVLRLNPKPLYIQYQ